MKLFCLLVFFLHSLFISYNCTCDINHENQNYGTSTHFYGKMLLLILLSHRIRHYKNRNIEWQNRMRKGSAVEHRTDTAYSSSVISNVVLKLFDLLLEGPEHLYYVCVCVCPSVCLSACLSVCLSIRPFVRLSVCVSLCLSVYLSVTPAVNSPRSRRPKNKPEDTVQVRLQYSRSTQDIKS